MFKEKSSSETQINCQKSCEKCGRNKSVGMPSSDLQSDHSNTTFSSNAISLHMKQIKRSHEDRYNISKFEFNKANNRADLFKRKHLKWLKEIEKSSDNPWITSGTLGSRDAVLVFRTSVLNAQISDSDTSHVSDSSNIDSSCTSSLDDGAKDVSDHSMTSSKTKVLFSLPKNSSNNSNSEIKKPCATLPFNSRLVGKTKLSITSPKKRMHDSLSSSDNSISSECGDPTEIEDDIAKATKSNNGTNTSKGNGTSYRRRSDETSKPNMKHVSFDDKENIEDPKVVNTTELPAAMLKITYKFMNTETRLLKRIFIDHGLTEVEENQNFSILWTGVHMKPDILRNLTPYQRVNHFPRSYELTRKDRLYKNIEKMQHLRGIKHFDIVPQSFILPLEYRDLVSAHNKYRGPWIVKPAASSRGRGIFIVNSPEQIPVDEQVLVSKYIADPLCIDGHKCDLRVYVVVTSFDPLLIYVYEEGLVRLATVKYDRNAENLWNPCMHLCNYSINKYHSDYIKSSDAQDEDVGHKWTLSALLRHLKSQGCDTRQLMMSIEDLIIKSMFACAQSIISACRMFVPNGNNCFELYGFDILIDDTLKPWLLEINLSPSLGIDSPLDAKVKASLMTDLLTLVGIPAYSPLMRSHYDSKWTRFRNINCRRTNSADHLNSTPGKKGAQQSVPLTPEEIRILRNTKLQHARRRGFVRIFPTEDTMQRYGAFLDPMTGIPISTSPSSSSCAMILPHNYNVLLASQLFSESAKKLHDHSFNARMEQYERALETAAIPNIGVREVPPKCVEEGKRLRKHIKRLIESGSEMTQLQARQAFGHYLECILRRLTHDPRTCHEKLILKFINRMSGSFKTPPFLRNPLNYRVMSKDRSAMVAKLLGDYLESYNRDTEAYIDSFDNYGMIPTNLFNEFLSQAQEADLESVLTLHTNLTHCMPFLYNRCGIGVPAAPPIPTGIHGFLKALPSMAPGGVLRDRFTIDTFYKGSDPTEYTSTSTLSSSASQPPRDRESDKKDKPSTTNEPSPLKILNLKKKIQSAKR